MTSEKIFEFLQKVNRKPKPYEYYTTPELWCDPYISQKMLELHINENTELASRKKDFIDRSTQWIIDRFKINQSSAIIDFGCGPGLYTTRFAETGAKITGIDFSNTSINYAKAKAEQNHLMIDYRLQDYLKFTSDKKFDLITMIYCDFCALNPNQRKTLLDKFYHLLNQDGMIFMDVSSFHQYESTKEKSIYEYSTKNGFWSKDPYFVFQNTFKYEQERLLLEKFTIIEKNKVRENYNWLQCYDKASVTHELAQNNLKVTEYYANAAGDPYQEASTEIAIVAEPL